LKYDVIVAENISKRYKSVTALKDVSFRVSKSEIHGFLGPNGAGKTTTMKILSTLLAPDSGKAYVHGYDVVKEAKEVRKHIALLMQQKSLDETLTVEENLFLFGKIHGINKDELKERIRDVLEELELSDLRKRIIMSLSMGQQRLVQLARTLILDRDTIFLDEPTENLDPRMRRTVWDIIMRKNKEGKTFFISTHYIDEAEYLCNKVTIINHGVTVATGTLAEFRDKLGEYVLELRTFKGYEENKSVLDKLLKEHSLKGYVTSTSVIIVSTSRDILENIVKENEHSDFLIRPLSLEDVFLIYTGKGFLEAWKYE